MSDTGNHIVLSESFEDNEKILQENECSPLNNELPGEHNDLVPKVGMKFKDENEIYKFYKKYAYHVGFPIKKRNSKKCEDGVLRYVAYACSREGKRTSKACTSLKPLPTIRVGCKAKITAVLVVLGIWRISTVHLEHNHETSLSKARLYRCNRQLSEHVKLQLEVNDIAGISLQKSYNSVVVENDGYEHLTFVEKNCKNYIDKVRKLRLGEGDVAAIQAYFSKMQALCPGFYFSVDLDEECQLKSVFWADNRCREAYKEFGDVVTFDTTYLINRYDMPFVSFVGVNHHGQLILLGCGLVSNEGTETFVWMFRTWLQCMKDQAPVGIITDQDKAMQNAIEIVFPNTKHRWCLWHILKKLPEKFGNHSYKASILSIIYDVVYESHSIEEFEQGWSLVIEKYTLHDNDWLSGIYRERVRWVPCFLKTSFWAGMSTMQQSESINTFFDGYVHSKTSLKQFVEQYERAMRCKVEKEFQADVMSFSQMVPCASRYPMEKQFQEVYTISKFKEFQDEFTEKMYCEVVSTEEGSLGTRYEVREDIIFDERIKEKIFWVVFEKEKCDIVCSCHMFEFRGIICKHVVTVLIRNGVRSIPERYILRRWRRDVSRSYMRVKINYNGWICTPNQLRYDKLCIVFAKIADLVADDEERTQSTIEWMESQLNALNKSNAKPS
ncbi:protein FAR1-RELATED SEQUENCE 5-like isoform X1 [Diospyros lotus]|uniref:protein FAR1-RELATED SEQUENCE 5-like isoform X1 n=1 Tax=Diospyros lotus TaxID=55363 RepID=UPI002253AB39|nr:protein FAR1-RELATED SEQUENCE 5-like isoform X1 [Diospyros lotus]XP_052195260.1 protein FAR1-RELATED SEQUENCE 5-like isoform X1 [Diospyros lotus]XP_052195268.1 protein FAR1-RELATED SEQUENCE 5-like isoform X1 [Diospyros lotus]